MVAGLVQYGWRRVQHLATISADTRAGRRFGRMGPGSSIAFPPATLFGEAWIQIGADSVIGQHVTLSAGMVPGLDLGPDPIIRIGDRCTIGRGSHIVGHQAIEIGDDVFTGPYVYITDQNHSYADPSVPVGRQWPNNEPVAIGSGSWLGAGVLILPGTRLGRNVVVAGGAVVRGEFGDHCVLAGVPARVVRRLDPHLGWRKTGADEPDAALDATSVPPA